MSKSLPTLSEQAKSLKKGEYEHFKGMRYLLVGVSRHSETLEEFVVYQALYGDKGLWIRPVKMFCEKVKAPDGSEKPRFRFVG